MTRRHRLHPRGPWFWLLLASLVALTVWALWPHALAAASPPAATATHAGRQSAP
jgi:hypothetical protein